MEREQEQILNETCHGTECRHDSGSIEFCAWDLAAAIAVLGFVMWVSWR